MQRKDYIPICFKTRADSFEKTGFHKSFLPMTSQNGMRRAYIVYRKVCTDAKKWSMQKLKSIVFVAGILLLILAAAMDYLSVKYLSAILPAESYEDKGVYTFSPYQVLPIQVQNTGASGRDRRMNPTKTVYMVYYRATDGSGYEWADRAITRELGEEAMKKGVPVTRRVLSITGDRTYITVEPEQTAESYTAGLKRRYVLILAVSAAYILVYLAIWGVILSKRRR